MPKQSRSSLPQSNPQHRRTTSLRLRFDRAVEPHPAEGQAEHLDLEPGAHLRVNVERAELHDGIDGQEAVGAAAGAGDPGLEVATELQQTIAKTETGISWLWNDEVGAYCSRDVISGRSSGKVTSASFLSFYTM